jgi:hypothetical protein
LPNKPIANSKINFPIEKASVPRAKSLVKKSFTAGITKLNGIARAKNTITIKAARAMPKKIPKN